MLRTCDYLPVALRTAPSMLDTDRVDASLIAGIQVYTAVSSMPAQCMGSDSGGGAIVIWLCADGRGRR